jgi:hypothetical protein
MNKDDKCEEVCGTTKEGKRCQTRNMMKGISSLDARSNRDNQ